MIGLPIGCIVTLLWLTDPSLCSKVSQSPAHLAQQVGESAQLQCSHRIAGYDRLLWYLQSGNGVFTFLGYMNLNFGYPEDQYKGKFSLQGQLVRGGVQQYPSSLLQRSGEPATLHCSHNISSYNMILWYRQPRGAGTLELLGYIYHDNKNVEPPMETRLKLEGDGKKSGTMTISNVTSADGDAVYFCAASETQHHIVPLASTKTLSCSEIHQQGAAEMFFFNFFLINLKILVNYLY
ncbi:uncharacterized protein LOC135243149 [Anguilla rostrata]|uniref:uncharacterized protein LOC135243149 n=1 Tax=Anguilla rostrata TaxID=7938 RepID=UPI0030CFB587